MYCSTRSGWHERSAHGASPDDADSSDQRYRRGTMLFPGSFTTLRRQRRGRRYDGHSADSAAGDDTMGAPTTSPILQSRSARAKHASRGGTESSPMGRCVKSTADAYLRAVGVPPSALTAIPPLQRVTPATTASRRAPCGQQPKRLNEVTDAGSGEFVNAVNGVARRSYDGFARRATSASANGRPSRAPSGNRWAGSAREGRRDSDNRLRELGRTRRVESLGGAQGTHSGGVSPVVTERVEERAWYSRASSEGGGCWREFGCGRERLCCHAARRRPPSSGKGTAVSWGCSGVAGRGRETPH
eukprot:scaffold7994_cov122-Isochrysis_galbana.AAC.14